MTALVIYPWFKASYYGFYLQGLWEIFPGARAAFSLRGFPQLHHHCLAFRISGRNIYVSAGDGPGINQEALAWCHVYAKVNLGIDVSAAKLFPVGPSFGLRFLPLWRAFCWSLRTCRRPNGVTHSLREHFAEYWRQWRYRLPERDYQPSPPHPNYVFYLGTLWKQEPETNTFRANFIRACRSVPALRFEGGLISRPDVAGFDDVVAPERISLSDYIQKTRSSVVVFNTPAVQGCHGWKLAEFLALGKVVISTPLKRMLPAPLAHGVHIHYTDGSADSLKKALEFIHGNPAYQASLGKAAREYYDRYLAPKSVMGRILRQAGVTVG